MFTYIEKKGGVICRLYADSKRLLAVNYLDLLTYTGYTNTTGTHAPLCSSVCQRIIEQ